MIADRQITARVRAYVPSHVTRPGDIPAHWSRWHGCALYDLAMDLRPSCPWWPTSCRYVSVVKLDEKSLGLRFECASGERMTMPLAQATLKMLRHA